MSDKEALELAINALILISEFTDDNHNKTLEAKIATDAILKIKEVNNLT